jgi:hypothetical protein
VVGAGGQWFQPPGGARASLKRRRPLALVLARLALEWRERPGVALSWEELLAAGWPGERVARVAGRNRVHSAVAMLRGLGLRELLFHQGGGYLLDPDVPVREA